MQQSMSANGRSTRADGRNTRAISRSNRAKTVTNSESVRNENGKPKTFVGDLFIENSSAELF